jgi:uncharacterized membrane protein HdeD (DUF308 family)
MDSASENVVRALQSSWWLTILRGIAILALGVYTVVTPFETAAAFIFILGAFAIVDGLFMLFTPTHSARGWRIAIAILLVLWGLAALFSTWLTTLFAVATLIYMVAALIILGGMMTMSVGMNQKHYWHVAGGFLAALAGALVILWPSMTLLAGLAMAMLVGFSMIFCGIALILAGMKLRSIVP